MPVADISGDYRSDSGQGKFPRLKLQEGEKARIVIATKPVVEYVHRLEAPNIVNMAPTYKKIKNRDGVDQYVVDTRFVSGPICHGRYEVLKERGFDESCPACQVARDRPEIFRLPQPKYSLNVLRYGLRPGGGWNDIANPFGVSALIWVFGGKVMDKLIDIRSMGPAYDDIREVDLLLQCDDKTFQKPYSNGEFMPYSPAVWMSNDQTRQYTVTYLASNGASNEDLAAAIGKKVKADWLADDINRCIQRWDVVRAYEARQGGAPSVGQPGFGAETLQQGMGQLQQQYTQGGQPGYQPQMAAQGFVPPGPQGYSPQQAPPPPPNGFGGVDMGLLNPGGQQQPPQSPGQPLYDQQGNPAGIAQWQPPGQLGDMFAPPTTPPATTPVTPTAPVMPAAPTVSAPSASGTATATGLGDALVPPPAGLAGLNEFMGAKTSNPSPGAQPPVAPPDLTPPAASADAPALPAGGSWTFDDLAKAAKQNGQ